MELFRDDGCLTEEGLHAVVNEELDELGRLEAAEHLAYCDKCLDRYTALLTADALTPPPHSVKGAVMGTVWVRVMQNTWGRSAVAAVAAVLAITMWRSGALENLSLTSQNLQALLPSSQTQQQAEPEPDAEPERLGKPYESSKASLFPSKLFSSAEDASTPSKLDAIGRPADTANNKGDNVP